MYVIADEFGVVRHWMRTRTTDRWEMKKSTKVSELSYTFLGQVKCSSMRFLFFLRLSHISYSFIFSPSMICRLNLQKLLVCRLGSLIQPIVTLVSSMHRGFDNAKRFAKLKVDMPLIGGRVFCEKSGCERKEDFDFPSFVLSTCSVEL